MYDSQSEVPDRNEMHIANMLLLGVIAIHHYNYAVLKNLCPQ